MTEGSLVPVLVAGSTFARRRDKSKPLVRVVAYVRPDGLAAGVYLNEEFEVSEIVWTTKEPTKRVPEGESFWLVTPRRK